MEPVTHILTGACMARALGVHRKLRHATLTMAIAAEIPDADYIYRPFGPLVYFQHHRGWTHSLLWLPVMAAISLGIVCAWHTWGKRNTTGLPLRWLPLFGLACLALLSHLLLDWTNNYGVRPFAPFQPRWFQGEIVFIVEPVILLLLGLALALTPIFRLTDKEIGVRHTSYAGQRLAIAALTGMVALWGLRWYEHGQAMQIAQQQEMLHNAPILRVGLNPMPINPFRWYAVIETPDYYQIGYVNTRIGTMDYDAQSIYYKQPVTPAVMAAKTSLLGRVYLDWSRYPYVGEKPLVDTNPNRQRIRTVLFTDLRFGYDIFNSHAGNRNPLGAAAYVDEGANRVLRMEVNGHEQKLP